MRKGTVSSPSHKFVEVGELAALALPAHPGALFRIPLPRSVKEIKRTRLVGRVARVERGNTLRGRDDDLFVDGGGLGRRIGEVGEQREVQIRLTIRQELHLEVLECLVYRLHRWQERGYYHGSSQLRRNPSRLLEVELWKDAGREYRRDEHVHDAYRDVDRW